ncbi:oxysterol-binding protein-related protein 4B-like [Impatiens glandulifera]|uniref:oxysterol-binding protein-related protein 4B-like n=1 Tax=Impatiens glandulifera TaxID=253017 RepID=UPI001FB14CE2|nr:oxysterol-binding protein-related protein 4B-like [Impatiens glandulifera]
MCSENKSICADSDLKESPAEKENEVVTCLMEDDQSKVVEEGDVRTRSAEDVILTAPMSLDESEEDPSHYRAPNVLRRILTLLKSMRLRPGSDLTRVQVPPVFNLPKSVLQSFGESIYCIGEEECMVSRCARGPTSLDRFISVVAWNISTIRPFKFGVAFYNSILGETHHVSRGDLNVLLEQVSHHPPVTALHATNEKDGVSIIWCQRIVPKFHGTKVDAEVQGIRQLQLVHRDETYIMSHPNLEFRFFPMAGVYWSGKFAVQCLQTDFECELSFVRNPFFLGNKSNQSGIKGKIFVASSKKTLFEVNGHWDRTVTIKDITNGKVSIIYDAKQMLTKLKTPVVKNPKGVWDSESAVVWSKVSKGILNRNWEMAGEAKYEIEEKQREIAKERELKGEVWIPKYFNFSYTKEDGWTCSPKQESVPPAPIIVPI